MSAGEETGLRGIGVRGEEGVEVGELGERARELEISSGVVLSAVRGSVIVRTSSMALAWSVSRSPLESDLSD